ncbi:hypothetical protein [Nibribacter koreensis]|uniref:Uncharacterized protein n=1 Tax=Nibribacter koreensis TaxID=1084519 RepID=A0ABP8F5J7_9BACT
MENNLEPKSLADLIQNPSEISAIISDPAESGVKFYQSLHNKDKSYVAFAAGVGLLAYGLYLSRSGSSASKSGSSNQGSSAKGNTISASTAGTGGQSSATTGEGNKNTSTKELNVKKNK